MLGWFRIDGWPKTETSDNNSLNLLFSPAEWCWDDPYRTIRLNAKLLWTLTSSWRISAVPPNPRASRAGCHVIGRKSISNFCAIAKREMKSSCKVRIGTELDVGVSTNSERALSRLWGGTYREWPEVDILPVCQVWWCYSLFESAQWCCQEKDLSLSSKPGRQVCSAQSKAVSSIDPLNLELCIWIS